MGGTDACGHETAVRCAVPCNQDANPVAGPVFLAYLTPIVGKTLTALANHDGNQRKAWSMACRAVSCEQVPQDTVTDTTQGERSVGMCRSAAAGDAGVDVELAGAHQPGGGRIGEIERP